MGKISSNKTILIAEDEEINFFLIEKLLEIIAPSIKVVRAINGQVAVDLCKKQNFELVLMDIKMPIMDGYEATSLIKKEFPKLPIVVQTAYSSEEAEKKAELAGCDDFVSKPINEQKFNAIIKKFFAKEI